MSYHAGKKVKNLSKYLMLSAKILKDLNLAWLLALQVRTVGSTSVSLLCPWTSCAGTSVISSSHKSMATHSLPASHTRWMWSEAHLSAVHVVYDLWLQKDRCDSSQSQCHYWVGGLSEGAHLPSPFLVYINLCLFDNKQTCSPRLF